MLILEISGDNKVEFLGVQTLPAVNENTFCIDVWSRYLHFRFPVIPFHLELKWLAVDKANVESYTRVKFRKKTRLPGG